MTVMIMMTMMMKDDNDADNDHETTMATTMATAMTTMGNDDGGPPPLRYHSHRHRQRTTTAVAVLKSSLNELWVSGKQTMLRTQPRLVVGIGTVRFQIQSTDSD